MQDPLDAEALRLHITSQVLGRTHHAFGTVGSTMDVARRIAAGGAPHGTLITAEKQMAGRGRRGRAWSSRPGLGVWSSVVLRGEESESFGTNSLGLTAACAIVLAVRQCVGCEVGAKWPNDVLACPSPASAGRGTGPGRWPGDWLSRARKIAGVLIEAVREPKPLFVVGVGINVHHREDDFPPEVATTASSIDLCEGGRANRAVILGTFLAEFEKLLSLNLTEQHTFWRAESLTIGREVEVHKPGGILCGHAEEIDSDGSLLVSSEGVVHRITGGESSVRFRFL